MPQLVPSPLAAFCLTSAAAVGASGTALALTGAQLNILALKLYSRISDTGTDLPYAAALSLVLLALCSLIIAVAEIAQAGFKALRGAIG